MSLVRSQWEHKAQASKTLEVRVYKSSLILVLSLNSSKSSASFLGPSDKKYGVKQRNPRSRFTPSCQLLYQELQNPWNSGGALIDQ